MDIIATMLCQGILMITIGYPSFNNVTRYPTYLAEEILSHALNLRHYYPTN